MIGRPPQRSFEQIHQRFWTKITFGAPDECWPWTAGTDDDGYGIFKPAGRNRRATRVLMEMIGKLPKPDEQVCHHCDNPPCMNPHHLYNGTHEMNVRDRDARKRTLSGFRHGSTKLTRETILAIRADKRTNNRVIAEDFGLSKVWVRKIRNGMAWADIC